MMLFDVVPPGADRVVASGPILYLVGIAFSLLCAAATWALAKLQAHLASQKEQGVFASVAMRVAHFATIVVNELEATLKPQLTTLAGKGTLTSVDIARLREDSLRRLKELLGKEGLQEVQGALGIGATTVDAYLHGVIEKQVAALPSAPAALGK